MRLNTSTPILFALSSLLQLGSSLPFFHRRAALVEPLVRRATYSVVPVDGGPSPTAANGSPDDTATVVETIVQTQTPATTETIIETDNITLPPTTDYVASTRTVPGSKTTQTIVVTLTPSASTTTTTDYSVIDVNPTVTTTDAPAPPAILSTSASISSSLEPSSAPTTTATSASSSATSSSTISEAESVSTSYTPTVVVSPSTSTSSPSFTTPTSTSSKPAYDNGQWHTYYPTWSNSTRTATPVVKSAEATPSIPTLPSLPTSVSVRIPEGSVPGLDSRSEEYGIEKRVMAASPNSAAPRSDADELLLISGAEFLPSV